MSVSDGSTKVFGIGLSKTGTSSLDAALNQLGIRSIHYPCDKRTYDELTSGCFRLSVLDQFQGVTDISVSPFYAQLFELYPDSLYILTVRELDAWLESIDLHWQFMRNWCKRDDHFRRFSEFITASVYGVHSYQRDRFAHVYQQHCENVRTFFQNKPGRLLEMDICAGAGWEVLCPFLEMDMPDQPFPFANRRTEKATRQEWMTSIDLAEQEIAASIPTDKCYILVDGNELAGSPVARPDRALPFLEYQGEYWGPPRDSIQAMEELDRMRNGGINYLVLSWPVFWWREHYEDFVQHLRHRFRRLVDSERLEVFDMQKM